MENENCHIKLHAHLYIYLFVFIFVFFLIFIEKLFDARGFNKNGQSKNGKKEKITLSRDHNFFSCTLYTQRRRVVSLCVQCTPIIKKPTIFLFLKTKILPYVYIIVYTTKMMPPIIKKQPFCFLKQKYFHMCIVFSLSTTCFVQWPIMCSK